MGPKPEVSAGMPRCFISLVYLLYGLHRTSAALAFPDRHRAWGGFYMVGRAGATRGHRLKSKGASLVKGFVERPSPCSASVDCQSLGRGTRERQDPPFAKKGMGWGRIASWRLEAV